MRAEGEGREERAFEMHPENCGAVGGVIGMRIFKRSRDRIVNACDLFNRCGDGGRHPCGGAFAREMTAESDERVGRRVHHVDAMRAVHLQIDEAGQDVIVADTSGGIERRDPIGERDAPANDRAVGLCDKTRQFQFAPNRSASRREKRGRYTRSKVSSLPGNIATAAPLSASTCSHPNSSVMSLSCAMVAKVSSTRKRRRRIILFSCSIFDARSSSAMSTFSV